MDFSILRVQFYVLIVFPPPLSYMIHVFISLVKSVNWLSILIRDLMIIVKACVEVATFFDDFIAEKMVH